MVLFAINLMFNVQKRYIVCNKSFLFEKTDFKAYLVIFPKRFSVGNCEQGDTNLYIEMESVTRPVHSNF